MHSDPEKSIATRRKKPSAGTVCILVLLLLSLFALIYVVRTPDIKEQLGLAAAAPAAPADAVPLPEPSAQPTAQAPEGAVDIWVLDVGQGDCAFLRAPDGATMLIDAGDADHRGAVLAFLRAQKVEKLDVVVATHPHSDHIGGMAAVIRQYPIGAFWMPEAENDAAAYEAMRLALAAEQANVEYAAAGIDAVIPWADGVCIRILNPFVQAGYPDLNEASVIINIGFGASAMLFAADAGVYAEMLSVANLPPAYFRADAIKLGHHGSSDASCPAFLDAVKPQIAVVSCGKDNPFGHPHKQTLDLLAQRNIRVLRTDLNGTIHLHMTANGLQQVTDKGL